MKDVMILWFKFGSLKLNDKFLIEVKMAFYEYLGLMIVKKKV